MREMSHSLFGLIFSDTSEQKDGNNNLENNFNCHEIQQAIPVIDSLFNSVVRESISSATHQLLTKLKSLADQNILHKKPGY